MKTSVGVLIMFSWLQLNRLSRGEDVQQHPSTLSVREGGRSVLNCSYSDSASSYFPWYKQERGKGPQLLTYIRSTMATKEDQRLTVSLNKAPRHLSLHIRDTRPEDSAVYFCAAGTRCFPGTCCLRSNLPLGQPPPSDPDLQGELLGRCLSAGEANVLDCEDGVTHAGFEHFVGDSFLNGFLIGANNVLF